MSAENVEQGPSFEMPKSPQEQVPTEEKSLPGIEQGGPSREATPHAPAQAVPLPAAPPATQPAGQPSTAPAKSPTPQTDSPTADLPAKDSDLIEKEWVDKAKRIVADTKEDPHKQKAEMSRVKADYVQKRFNKTIKLDDPFDGTQGRPELGRTGDAAAP